MLILCFWSNVIQQKDHVKQVFSWPLDCELDCFYLFILFFLWFMSPRYLNLILLILHILISYATHDSKRYYYKFVFFLSNYTFMLLWWLIKILFCVWEKTTKIMSRKIMICWRVMYNIRDDVKEAGAVYILDNTRKKNAHTLVSRIEISLRCDIEKKIWKILLNLKRIYAPRTI